MNRDEITRLAREIWGFENWSEVQISRFERLVAAAMAVEREACARVCEEPGWNAANWCAKQIRARGEHAQEK